MKRRTLQSPTTSPSHEEEGEGDIGHPRETQRHEEPADDATITTTTTITSSADDDVDAGTEKEHGAAPEDTDYCEEGKGTADTMKEPLLHVVTARSDIWKAVVKVLSDVVEAVDLDFDANGMLIRTWFNNKCSFLSLHFKPKMFPIYILQEPSFTLRQSLDRLKHFLSRGHSSRSLTLRYYGNDCVIYDLSKKDQACSGRTTRLNTLSPEESTVSDFKRYDHCIKLRSKFFRETVEDIKTNHETDVRVRVTPTRTQWMTRSVYGHDCIKWPHRMVPLPPSADSYAVQPPLEEDDVEVIQATDESFDLLFAVDTLQVPASAWKVADYIQIYFSRQHPMGAKFEFTMDDGLGQLFFILGCRVDVSAFSVAQ